MKRRVLVFQCVTCAVSRNAGSLARRKRGRLLRILLGQEEFCAATPPSAMKLVYSVIFKTGSTRAGSAGPVILSSAAELSSFG